MVVIARRCRGFSRTVKTGNTVVSTPATGRDKNRRIKFILFNQIGM